ncbi:fimbrillin family protein [Paraprevotella sp.]|uniref:fimbrillin family protein n=1 Tax=Paraprevotella sp. TaxID=2049036 RepID=UPI00257D7FC9|nr:fimbrillin family protein [Paraprevotella sp.]
MKHRYRIWGWLAMMLLFIGCRQDEIWTGDDPLRMDYLQIEGEIASAMAVRAVPDNKLTMSYDTFGSGDTIGFFSYHDPNCAKPDRWSHRKGNDDTLYLKNTKLTYSDMGGARKFTSTEVANVALGKFGVTFAYFPFAPKEKMPPNYVKSDGSSLVVPSGSQKGEHYIHIFTEDGHIVDLLTAQKMQYDNINYQFRHRFAMVLLFLGEGFSPDTEGNGKLTVNLTYHVLGAHILRKEIDPFPYEDFPLTVDTVPLDKASEYGFGRSSFTAPRVDGYTLLVGQEPRTVYPVILPAGAKIDYIEVKDKTGKLQRVKPARGEALTGLEGGWKHPLTIRMEGIVPTVYPHEIIDWNEQHVGEVDKLPGIHSEEQFAAWLKVYNRNVDKWEAMNVADSVELAHYGVHNDGETPGTDGWTFYLWNDIDCKDMKPDANGAFVKALTEGVTFDGKGYVLHNLMLDFEHTAPSSGRVGLIGEIRGGRLRNLHLDFVTVRNMTADALSGCIAGCISGGEVYGCTVREAAMMCRDGVAGVLAGEMTGGRVSDCKFHGMVQARDMQDETGLDYKKIVDGVVGRMPSGFGGSVTGEIINRVLITD